MLELSKLPTSSCTTSLSLIGSDQLEDCGQGIALEKDFRLYTTKDKITLL